MNDFLNNLIESLREELKQYGELLALLDQQQEKVLLRQTQDLLQTVAAVNTQSIAIRAARLEREQYQRNLARHLGMPESASFAVLIPALPADYRPLVQALVQENNELLVRVQQRARQNHLFLGRALELMQRFITSLCPAHGTPTYSDAGGLLMPGLSPQSLYDAVG
jgi:flagellar biosynthesis/type III secretory pathway chaperone